MTSFWPAVERLLEDLNDSGWRNRCRAARALGELGDARAVAPLLSTLKDRSAAVRREAVCALGRLRDARALSPLIGALDDVDDEVRRRAVVAVKAFGQAVLAPLLDVFHQGGPRLRQAAVGVLEGFRTPMVTDLLVAALDDPDRTLRSLALSALVLRKDPRAVVRLIAGLGEPGRRREACVRALGMVGDPIAFEPLGDLLVLTLTGDDAPLQMAVVKALRKIDNARAVDLLHALLDDESNPGRDRLLQTLAVLDLLGAVGSLCRKVKQGTVDSDRLRRALSAIHAEAEQAGRDGSDAVAPGDRQEALRRSAAALRQLETNLRELAQGE